jgi:dihydrolipoamide dehydrogenase
MLEKKDIAVIGGGPGGYVAAIRAAQLRKKVVVFEEDRIGGTCMNYGCIPTKHLLHQTHLFQKLRTGKNFEGPADQITLNWKTVQEDKGKVVDRLVRGVEFLFQRYGIEIVRGTAALKDERTVIARTEDGETQIEADRIILATGSRPADLPFLRPDGALVVTSREALEFASAPKSLLVVGAGAIGIEMATIYHRLGTNVTVLEILPTALPGSDKEMAARLELVLKKQGLKVLTSMRIEKCLKEPGRVVLKGTSLKDQSRFELAAERVLLAAGRKPNSEGLAAAGGPQPGLCKGGFVQVNDRLETNIPGIYAIGDLVGGKLLAHKASHEGLAAAANACGGREVVDHRALPTAVFTEPEFASVGWTEEEARAAADGVRTGIFSFQANGRALTLDSPDGMVKIVAGKDDRILGAHILGPSASDLLAELTLAMHKGLTVRDVASAVHIHPTLSEAVMEAALKVHGEAIHAMND